MNKYIVEFSLRRAHFLGQGAVESSRLRSMQEKASIKLLMKMVGQSAEVLFRTHYVMRIRTWVIGMVQLRLRSMDTSLVLNIILVEDRIAGSYDWILGNCDTEDAQKFRGRGF